MSFLPRQPGDPPSVEDIIFILSMAAAILLMVFVVFPLMMTMMMPAPDEIIRFYANGTALLGNGTLIDVSNLTAVY